MTDFLVNVLRGATSISMFPKDLLDHGPAFTPSTLESSTPAAAARTSVSTRTIRDRANANANANGYDLPERGRIPIEIIEAWKHGSMEAGESQLKKLTAT
ncbi:Lsr2 family DNA-binding protein [Streptomyces wedmorensis]